MVGMASKSSKIEKIVYFHEPGPANTEEVLKIVKEASERLGIKTVVVASTTGETGVKAVQLLKGLKVVVVTHAFGLRGPNIQEIKPENREKILQNGGFIVTATHVFGGIGRAVRARFNTIQIDEIVANVLRIFGEGMKVACEITLMAADAGLIRTDEEIIAVAGSGRGCDTAIVLQPVNTQRFFDLKVKEILCKPRL